jgi:hypothetical protein
MERERGREELKKKLNNNVIEILLNNASGSGWSQRMG